MAYAQISNIIPQYENYPNYWLKAYEASTTTPLSMATASDGLTLASKFEINAQGFPVTAGAALVIPYLNAPYDMWLFPTEAEADANDTGSAIQVADNISPSVTDGNNSWTGTNDFVSITQAGNAVVDVTTEFTTEGTGETTIGERMAKFVMVTDFGADPLGVSDSTTAIQAAVDTGRDVYFPLGKYLTTATITSDTEGQAFIGVGGNGNDASTRTEIECSATSGAVIRYRKRSFTMQGFKITSDATRFAASPTDGHGIWGEAEDAVLTQSSRPVLRDIWIVEQPSTGVYLGGGHEYGLLDTVTVQDCKTHGFVFDDGTYGGRTNKDVAPFEMEVNRCRAFECGGNACLVGYAGDSDITRLIRFVQFEALGCAWDSSERISHHQIIDRGIQITWDMVDIEDQQYGNATTSGGNSRTAQANPSAGVDSYRDYSEFKYPYFSSITESLNCNVGGNGIKVINPNIALGTYGVAQADAIVIPNTVEDFYGEFNSSRITGATDIVQNQSVSSKYYIDGVLYKGINNSTLDFKVNDTPETGTISSGTLDSTSSKISLVGEGDTTDTLNRIRYASGFNGREGDEMTLIFGGGSSYTITINDVTTGGTNIRTNDGTAISMTSTTRSIVRFMCNASLEWIEI